MKTQRLGKGLIAMGIVLVSLLSAHGMLMAAVGDVAAQFLAPSQWPAGLTYDGQNLWMSDYRTDTLYRIDPITGKVVQTLSAPGLYPLGLTWDGSHLWVIDAEAKMIFRVNPKSGVAEKIIESYSVSPQGIAWDGKYLWLVDGKRDLILKVNPADGMMISKIPSPAGNPQGLTFDGRYLWVSDRSANRIFCITPEKGQVIVTLHAPGPYSRGLAWDGKYLWNVDYQTDRIYKLKISDPGFRVRYSPLVEWMEYAQEFHNFGPGTVKELDIYIALPQNRDNQEILEGPYFDPKPTDFLTDRWGQKVAHFRFKDLKPYSKVEPKVRVKVKLYAVDYHIFPEKVGSLDQIPREIREKYLSDGQKYQINHPLIQQSAREAVGDEKNPYWMARRIFDYVIEKISYKLKPLGGWNPAPTVLERGTGSCSEYTFVFIAMCRAVGLPARYVGSLAIRGDLASRDDVFHRWAEVYLPNYGWIPFDANKGDQSTPAGQASGIGNLANRYLITTTSGGDSEYLSWYYNFNFKWTSLGPCKIYTEQFGEWSPAQ